MANIKTDKIRVGISVGDTNGVGLEIIIKVFKDPRMFDDIIPIIYGNTNFAKLYRKELGIQDFSFHSIPSAEDAVAKKANMVEVWDDNLELKLGHPTSDSGISSWKSLQAAVEDLASNKIDTLVTAPIDKENINKAGFEFPGHTEYLSEMANVDDSLMFLVARDLRVGVVTGHIPLKEVSVQLSTEKIVNKIRLMSESLIRDFGIRRPKIAVLGLNPHAGDNGLLGDEEKEIIQPAINITKEEGIMVMGPYGADGLFGSPNYKSFDGILAMYHDQGLAPFKAMAFDDGVNFTAGLPIVRTSPDHGTAFPIAGQGVASENSMRQAIFLACDIYRQRIDHRELTSNPLEAQKPREEKKAPKTSGAS